MANKGIGILFILLVFTVSVPHAGQSQDEALLEAAEKGDIEGVKILLSKGANIDAKGDYRSDTALIKAATRGHEEIVRILLTKGAKVNEKDKFGATSLMYAASEGYTKIAEVLIERSADVNARDNYGRTALIDAVNDNQHDIVKILLSKGAEVNAEDNSGATSWVYAAESGYTEIVKLLKTAGAVEKYDVMEWSGQYSHKKNPSELVIINDFEWKRLWNRLFPERSIPDVDFNKYVVVCVFLGVRPAGGYSVEFGQPHLKDNKMIIPYKENKPEGVVTQAFTQPYKIKVFEKKGDVEVVIRED
jgi:serine/threonine-protein phosphatase 6 regulatory ankyrin repeat subunit B